MKKFNINDLVKIKLSEEGKTILRKYYVEQAEKSNNPEKLIKMYAEDTLSHIDTEGYLTIQLCDIIQIFGPAMNESLLVYPFANSTVLIEDRLLEDVPTGEILPDGKKLG